MRMPISRPFSLIEQEKRAMERFILEVQERKPTLEDPLIVYDLFGQAPLTAMLGFVTNFEVDLMVTVHGKTSEGNLSYALAGRELIRSVPIVGLYPNEATKVTIAIGDRSYEYTLEAKVQVPDLPEYERFAKGPAQSLSFFLAADGKTPACAFDGLGDLRWWTPMELSHRLRLSQEGFLISGGPPALAPPKGPTDLVWLDLTGRIAKRIRRPAGFTGDFLELPDRTLVAIASSPERGTVADRLVWIDGRSGDELRNVDLKELLDPDIKRFGHSGSDWFAADSLRYEEERHVLTLSGLLSGEILELDAASGRLLKIVSKKNDAPLSEVVGPIFEGDQMVFLESHRFEEKAPSLIQVNLEEKYEELLWQGADGELSPVFNDWWPLAPEEALIHLGGYSDLPTNWQKKAPSSYILYSRPETKVWTRRFHLKHGRAQEIDRFGTAAIHSADIALSELRFVRAESEALDLGSWGLEAEVDIPLEFKDKEKADSELIERVWMDDRRLYLKGHFYQGDVPIIVLSQGEERHQYFIPNNRWPYGRDWLQSLTDDVLRTVVWAISLEGLEGSYELDLWLDERLYETNIELVV